MITEKDIHFLNHIFVFVMILSHCLNQKFSSLKNGFHQKKKKNQPRETSFLDWTGGKKQYIFITSEVIRRTIILENTKLNVLLERTYLSIASLRT